MSRVQLYVYDLSRGMAKQMSMMLTGKQIDGIWHTSVVAFGREVFYGQGILEARPGTTHHGQPMQIIDMGETHIDEGTFNEYIGGLAEIYSADKYHLIEWNCNTFTQDVVGFLTGGSIPPWISGLPAEFMSTPFGQAMRPQIDAMFRRTAPSEHPVNAVAGSSRQPAPAAFPTPPASGISTPTASSLLAAVAKQAAGAPSPSIRAPAAPGGAAAPASPLTLVSSTAAFDTIMKESPVVIVNFTNTPGCPPCRAIKPAYESLASEISTHYASKGVRLLEVELGVGQGQEIASRHGVRATPTFQFFRGGKRVDEMKGATKQSLEARVESFLEEVFPRHPHRKVYLPAVEGIPLSPITSSTVPNYSALCAKLEGFVSASQRPSAEASQHVAFLKNEVVPLLTGKELPDAQLAALFQRWTAVSASLLQILKPEETFPVIDLWRVGLLNPKLAALMAYNLSPETLSPHLDPVTPIIALAVSTLSAQGISTPKPLLLTILRLLTNLVGPLPLANLIFTGESAQHLAHLRSGCITILVESLLHADGPVRSASAGVAINVAAWRHRNAKDTGVQPEDGQEADWEVELVSALVEGLGREEDEDVAHRLLAALALLLWLAPGFENSLRPLLEVLGAKDTLGSKTKVWKKKEVKKLGEEVVKRLI